HTLPSLLSSTLRRATRSTLFPYTTLFRSSRSGAMFLKRTDCLRGHRWAANTDHDEGFSISRLMAQSHGLQRALTPEPIRCLFCEDRKSTRLNSSHVSISYAVFCLKKKMIQ